MRIKFSDTSTKDGLVQFYEKEIGADYGDVSGNTNALYEFTARANSALDDYNRLWATSAGTWQSDDINFTDYPIVTANIVSGQRDYPFTTDGNSNRIIDVQKVLILPSSTATNYEPMMPVDELVNYNSEILVNSNTGTPYQYGKLANAIFLDPVPDYSVTAGLKMIVTREGSYFVSTDTAKVAGIPAFHEYLYLKPALEYARIHSSSNYNALLKRVIELEGDEGNRITGKIQSFFGQREKDVDHRITMEQINYM